MFQKSRPSLWRAALVRVQEEVGIYFYFFFFRNSRQSDMLIWIKKETYLGFPMGGRGRSERDSKKQHTACYRRFHKVCQTEQKKIFHVAGNKSSGLLPLLLTIGSATIVFHSAIGSEDRPHVCLVRFSLLLLRKTINPLANIIRCVQSCCDLVCARRCNVCADADVSIFY